jgi:hypothetical protein
MKKRDIPLVIIILSLGLILFRFFTTDELDKNFFWSVLSSVLLIVAMIVTIKDRNKKV